MAQPDQQTCLVASEGEAPLQVEAHVDWAQAARPRGARPTMPEDWGLLAGGAAGCVKGQPHNGVSDGRV